MKHEVKIMGILNVTPDSFYAASRLLPDGHFDADAFAAAVQHMLDAGADILDLGACSTRPGSQSVDEAGEWSRLEPALRVLADAFPQAVVSVDTFRAGIVARSVDTLGRSIIVNDISAGDDDAAMLPLCGRLGLSYVAMHKRGTPDTMQSLCDYEDVTAEVAEYFDGFAQRAAQAGVEDWILDPGFGFAKTVAQNFQLMEQLGSFARFGRPVLVGISRKSFICKTLGITPDQALTATQTMHMAALERGASILRVHDVEAAVQTRELFTSLAATRP